MMRRFCRLPKACGLLLGISTAFLVASAASAQTITRGPYLQSVSPTAVTVRWRTDVATGSRVDLGDNPGSYSSSVTDPSLTTEHEMRLTGLLSAHRYAYGVGQPGALLTPADATYSFTTAPPAGSAAPVRAWIVGDSGHNNTGAQAVRDKFESYSGSRPPDLWLMLGDNAYASVPAPYALSPSMSQRSGGRDPLYDSNLSRTACAPVLLWPESPTIQARTGAAEPAGGAVVKLYVASAGVRSAPGCPTP